MPHAASVVTSHFNLPNAAPTSPSTTAPASLKAKKSPRKLRQPAYGHSPSKQTCQKCRKRAAWFAVQEQWGRIDILVNNAGITKDKSMKKLTDDDWNDVLDTNLGSVYATCSEVLKIMMDQKYGRIINITSFVGQAGNFGQANYAASKGGIIAFTKTLALEMAKYNITVNAIAPGFTETEMLAQVPENIREQIIARVPMGRFGKPEEIARAVVFLAAEGDYITGQQINVNGGVYM